MFAGRFTFPGPRRAEWCSKRRARTHSGGTAPDLHRTSLLCPSWAPKASKFLSLEKDLTQVMLQMDDIILHEMSERGRWPADFGRDECALEARSIGDFD